MDQGHTHVDKYNLPEENILLEDGDRPQDVPDLWVPPNMPQGGPDYHQPPYRNIAPPDTPPDYSCWSLMYHTPSRSKSPGEKGKCGASDTSHESSEEAQDTWHPLPNVDSTVGHWEYNMSHIPFAMTLDGPAFVRQPEAHERQWVQVFLTCSKEVCGCLNILVRDLMGSGEITTPHLHSCPLLLLKPALSMGILEGEEELHHLSQNRLHLATLAKKGKSVCFWIMCMVLATLYRWKQ